MAIIGEIRKRSWIAVVIVGVAIVAFIISDLFKGNSKQPPLGVIDGKEVSYNRFNELFNQRETLLKKQQQSDQITTEQSNQIRENVWNELIETQLTSQEYEQLGLQVSQREMNDMYMGDFIHPYLRQMFTDPSTGVYNPQIVAQWINNFDQLTPAQQEDWVSVEEYVKLSRQQEK